MKAIYSYKVFPDHHKPLDDTFWKLAYYSVKSASKYYSTTLYTDDEGKEVFDKHGIYFDEYCILDKIEKYKGRVYSVPKLYAMIAEKEPYVHIDFDAVILEEIVTTHSITYAYTEVDLINLSGQNHMYYAYTSYVRPYRDLLTDIFAEDIVYPEFNEIPNHSFIMVKNPKVVSELYKKILSKIPEDVLEEVSPTLLEQGLLFLLLKENKVDTGYLNWHGAEKFLEREFGSYKFVHLPYYDSEHRSEEVQYVVKKLEEQFGPINDES